MESIVILSYWPGRGLGSFIRYTLEAAGVPYEETRYSNHEDWFIRDKPSLTMVLPNLANLKDGAVHISEHDAIIRYIAKKYKPELLGIDDQEYAFVENFFSCLT